MFFLYLNTLEKKPKLKTANCLYFCYFCLFSRYDHILVIILKHEGKYQKKVISEGEYHFTKCGLELKRNS